MLSSRFRTTICAMPSSASQGVDQGRNDITPSSWQPGGQVARRAARALVTRAQARLGHELAKLCFANPKAPLELVAQPQPHGPRVEALRPAPRHVPGRERFAIAKQRFVTRGFYEEILGND